MKHMTTKLFRATFTIILLLFLLFTYICPTCVRADSSNNYSSVINDLSKDSSFKIEDYPLMTLDYFKEINSDLIETNDQPSIELIHIGESDKKELYLYFYQPINNEINLKAKSISMSNEFSKDGKNLNLSNYDLELISTYSVFSKYRVKNFIVSNDLYRYYNIVAVRREYSPSLDTMTGGTVTEDYEVSENCGQQWSVYYKNNSLVYEMATFETLEIEVNYSGFITYDGGFQLGNLIGNYKDGDIWFIAFDIEDYIVEKIFDADITCKTRSVMETTSYPGGSYLSEGEWSEDIKIFLTSLEEPRLTSVSGLDKIRYSYDRISKGTVFISSLESQGLIITESLKTTIKNSGWVFAFADTERTSSSHSSLSTTTIIDTFTQIGSITVLRIHFMDVTGRTYNLGVVSDRFSPDREPDGFLGSGNGCSASDWKLVVALLLVFLLIVLLNSLGILPLISKTIIFVVSLPFKFIKWIIDKFRGN